MPATHQRLYINIDHVATLRQARRADEPDPVEAALLCERAGADGITAHLREDRRHIQDRDVDALARRWLLVPAPDAPLLPPLHALALSTSDGHRSAIDHRNPTLSPQWP